MPCFKPLKGFRGRMRSASGKRPIVFSVKDGYKDMPVQVPCGKCIGCRLEYSRQWAMRIVHEASLHDENSFVTLTYDDEHLPEHGQLLKRDLQLFMKRLRKSLEPRKIRYYACGEYGDIGNRPHFHACLFGVDFAEDRYLWRKDGDRVSYRSPFLEKAWQGGHAEIGDLNFDTAAYTARYVMKKIGGEMAEEHYARLDEESGEVIQMNPEFALMSRRPGIGRDWYEKFKGETYRDDSVIMNGMEVRPPKYYDRLYEEEAPEVVARARAKRQRHRREEDETVERMEVREKCAKARVNLRRRVI